MGTLRRHRSRHGIVLSLVIGSSVASAVPFPTQPSLLRDRGRPCSSGIPAVSRIDGGHQDRQSPPPPPPPSVPGMGAEPLTEDESAGVDEGGVEIFARALFRGITFPFPMLRKLANFPEANGNDAAKTTTDDEGVGFSTRECLLAIGAYLALGVAAYSSGLLHNKPWSLSDALYFSVVTFTTVGYGDLCPTTVAGKAFTVLFGLFGISILGVAVAKITSAVLETELSVMQAAEQRGRDEIMGYWEHQEEDNKHGDKSDVTSNWWQTALSILNNSFPSLFVLLAGGLLMGSLEGWSRQDSVYYSFITAGTLGYGDFSPLTQKGRLWAVVFIPLAVGTAGELLGGVTTWMVQRRQKRFYRVQLERELDVDRLLEMDANKNERVSREEYVMFMLKEMQLVDDELFRELHGQFNKLDVDGGGYLDRRDLRLLVERRQREQVDQEGRT